MKYFLVTALCLTLTNAKPQYNYPTPTVPTLPNIPSTNYGTPGAILTGGGGIFSGGLGGVSSGLSTGISGFGISGGSGVGGHASGSISESFASTGVQSSGVKVYKDIYVHVAPPEPEELRPTKTIAAGQSTKHYKIIFIKAPSYETYQQQILQQQAQNQEKTLVYVLVQKPEQPGDITLPTVAPTPPSKPEVYFIKYKAKSQAVGGATIGGSSGTAQLIGTGGAATIGGVSGTAQLVGTGGSRPIYGPPGQSGPY